VRHRLPTGWFLLLGTAIALAACSPAATAQPARGVAPAGTETVHLKSRLTVAVSKPVVAFGYIGQTTGVGSVVTYAPLISAGLAAGDATGLPVPWLAQERPSLEQGTMAVLPDGRMTTRWTVRPNATWHDGTPITADDFAFSYTVEADPEIPVSDRSAIQQMESVQAIDAHSFLITWKHPYFLADSLGGPLLWALPAHILEQPYTTLAKTAFLNLPYWTSELVQSGPFRVAQYQPGAATVLVAHEGYFLGRPKIDEVIIREILDSNAVFASILAGDVDMTIELLDAAQGQTLREQWGSAGTVIAKNGGPQYLAHQFAPEIVQQPALLDIRARQAMYLAMDRPAMAEIAWGGRRVPEGEATSLLQPADPLFPYVKDVSSGSTSDPQRAIRMLAELGWVRGADGRLADAAGHPFTLDVRATRPDLGQAAVRMLQDIGVDASLTVPPPAASGDRQYLQSYSGMEIGGSGEGDRIFDRLNIATTPIASNGYAGQNRGHYASTQMTDLIGRYRASLTTESRGESMRGIAETVAQDLPIMMLYFIPVWATLGQSVHALDDMNGGLTGGPPFSPYTRSAHLWSKDT
jgi:peptide/nickel transport system substrate-binding protein